MDEEMSRRHSKKKPVKKRKKGKGKIIALVILIILACNSGRGRLLVEDAGQGAGYSHCAGGC